MDLTEADKSIPQLLGTLWCNVVLVYGTRYDVPDVSQYVDGEGSSIHILYISTVYICAVYAYMHICNYIYIYTHCTYVWMPSLLCVFFSHRLKHFANKWWNTELYFFILHFSLLFHNSKGCGSPRKKKSLAFHLRVSTEKLPLSYLRLREILSVKLTVLD